MNITTGLDQPQVIVSIGPWLYPGKQETKNGKNRRFEIVSIGPWLYPGKRLGGNG